MIRVQAEDFDMGTEIAKLSANNFDIGAVCAFLGLVRDMTDGTLQSLTLEHYPSMTKKELLKIEQEARARWSLSECLIVHRYGTLTRGDQIVLVATASQHREVAFESCQFLMDFLKTRAPFWKLENTNKGEKWVAARASDSSATARWMEANNK